MGKWFGCWIVFSCYRRDQPSCAYVLNHMISGIQFKLNYRNLLHLLFRVCSTIYNCVCAPFVVIIYLFITFISAVYFRSYFDFFLLCCIISDIEFELNWRNHSHSLFQCCFCSPQQNTCSLRSKTLSFFYIYECLMICYYLLSYSHQKAWIKRRQRWWLWCFFLW